MIQSFASSPEKLPKSLDAIDPLVQSLYLDAVQLQSLSQLPKLNCLRILSVNNNQIKNLDGLQYFPQLNSLFISNNRIQNFIGCFQHPNLSSFDLSGNSFGAAISNSFDLICASIFPKLQILSGKALKICKNRTKTPENYLNFALIYGIRLMIFQEAAELLIGGKVLSINHASIKQLVKEGVIVSKTHFFCKFGAQIREAANLEESKLANILANGFTLVFELRFQSTIEIVNGQTYGSDTLYLSITEITQNQEATKSKKVELPKIFQLAWNLGSQVLLTPESTLNVITELQDPEISVTISSKIVFQGHQTSFLLSDFDALDQKLTVKLIKNNQPIYSVVTPKVTKATAPNQSYWLIGKFQVGQKISFVTSKTTQVKKQMHAVSARNIAELLLLLKFEFEQFMVIMDDYHNCRYEVSNQVIQVFHPQLRHKVEFIILSRDKPSFVLPQFSQDLVLISIIDDKLKCWPQIIQSEDRIYHKETTRLLIDKELNMIIIRFTSPVAHSSAKFIIKYTEVSGVKYEKTISSDIINKLLNDEQFLLETGINLNQLITYSAVVQGQYDNGQLFSILSNQIDCQKIAISQTSSFHEVDSASSAKCEAKSTSVYSIKLQKMMLQYINGLSYLSELSQLNQDIDMNQLKQNNYMQEMQSGRYLFTIYNKEVQKFPRLRQIVQELKVINVYGLLEVSQSIFFDILSTTKNDLQFGVLADRSSNTHHKFQITSLDFIRLVQINNLTDYNIISINQLKYDFQQKDIGCQLYVFCMKQGKVDLIKIEGRVTPKSFVNQIFVDKIYQQDQPFKRKLQINCHLSSAKYVKVKVSPSTVNLQQIEQSPLTYMLLSNKFASEVLVDITDTFHESSFNVSLFTTTTTKIGNGFINQSINSQMKDYIQAQKFQSTQINFDYNDSNEIVQLKDQIYLIDQRINQCQPNMQTQKQGNYQSQINNFQQNYKLKQLQTLDVAEQDQIIQELSIQMPKNSVINPRKQFTVIQQQLSDSQMPLQTQIRKQPIIQGQIINKQERRDQDINQQERRDSDIVQSAAHRSTKSNSIQRASTIQKCTEEQLFYVGCEAVFKFAFPRKIEAKDVKLYRYNGNRFGLIECFNDSVIISNVGENEYQLSFIPQPCDAGWNLEAQISVNGTVSVFQLTGVVAPSEEQIYIIQQFAQTRFFMYSYHGTDCTFRDNALLVTKNSVALTFDQGLIPVQVSENIFELYQFPNIKTVVELSQTDVLQFSTLVNYITGVCRTGFLPGTPQIIYFIDYQVRLAELELSLFFSSILQCESLIRGDAINVLVADGNDINPSAQMTMNTSLDVPMCQKGSCIKVSRGGKTLPIFIPQLSDAQQKQLTQVLKQGWVSCECEGQDGQSKLSFNHKTGKITFGNIVISEAELAGLEFELIDEGQVEIRNDKIYQIFLFNGEEEEQLFMTTLSAITSYNWLWRQMCSN